jgi:L-rhamnonate dehydratase
MTLKIIKASISTHALAFSLPLLPESRGSSDRVLLEIETDEGIHGFGLTGRFMASGVAAILQHDVLPAVAGMDIANLERIHERIRPLIAARGAPLGAGAAALSCLDIAIWDALGKHRGQSVAQMLGGARGGAQVYVTYGFGGYSEDQLVEVAQSLISEGYSSLKVLVGVAKGGITEDARRVKAVRRAIGPDIALGIDANESLSYDEALRLCFLLRDEDISWFEEPIKGGPPSALGDLKRRCGIPIALGQFDGTLARFSEWIAAGAVDIFVPNSMYNGGFTETRRVAALSQAYGLPLSDAGGGGLLSLHHVAGLRNGTMTEMHLGIARADQQLFVDFPEPVKGYLSVPTLPGIGLELNREFLRQTCSHDYALTL